MDLAAVAKKLGLKASAATTKRQLVDELVAAKLCAEIDHRTFPEDVAFAVQQLKTTPKKSWTWADDVDEATSTADMLSLVAHRVPLVMIDLGADCYPVAAVKKADVAALVALGCTAIEPRAELAAAAPAPAGNEATVIAQEDAQPSAEARWVIAGAEKGAETVGVHYDEPHLGYKFFSMWRGKLGAKGSDFERKTGFASRDAAVAAAEAELADRIAQGWQRVSRSRLQELNAALAKKRGR